MVNANVVIAVSAILVAVILTIVFVLRTQGGPTDNFSLTVTGSISDGTVSYPAEMYYCIGDACQFYKYDTELPIDFPGYFALVGATIEGATYLTEHSIGKTFKFEGGALTGCFDAEKLDAAQLADRIDTLKATSATGFTIGKETFTVATTSQSNDPASDRPSLLGYEIPTAAECDAIWTPSPVTVVGGDSTEDPENISGLNDGIRHLDENGVQRTLWNQWATDYESSQWALDCANTAYDGSGRQGSTVWVNCITGWPLGSTAVARFVYSTRKYPYTMAVTFAGSNDAWDWILNLTQGGWGAPADLHSGFWLYVNSVQNCVNYHVDMLWNWGIDIDLVIGHSLGGAAATIYRNIQGGRPGMRNAVLDTWAAPKTTRWSACRFPGNRRFDEKDPVSGNGMGLMGSLNHDVQNAQRGYQGSYCTSSWWGMCTGWGTNYPTHSVGCNDVSGGCSWFFDCAYNIGRHSGSNYAKYNF